MMQMAKKLQSDPKFQQAVEIAGKIVENPKALKAVTAILERIGQANIESVFAGNGNGQQ